MASWHRINLRARLLAWCGAVWLFTFGFAWQAQAQEAPEEGAVRLEHERGRGLSLRAGQQLQARFYGRAQLRWLQGPGSTTQGVIPRRLRLATKGALREPALETKIQLAFEDGPELLDAYLDWQLWPGGLHLRMGRWKLPTYREFISSSGRLALVERSIVHEVFAGVRGDGLAVRVPQIGQGPWSAEIGVWSDRSDRLSLYEYDQGVAPQPSSGLTPAMAGRVQWLHGEEGGAYDQLDLKGEGLGVEIGASAHHSYDAQGGGRTRAALDWALDWRHVGAAGAVHASRSDGGWFGGWGAQQTVSYLWRGRFGPALRGAIVDPVGAPPWLEATGGLNLLLTEHRLKLTGDASWLTGPPTQRGWRVRAQLQLIL